MSVACLLTVACVFLGVDRADAQFGVAPPPNGRSIGETYRIEGSADFWSPSPFAVITSESLGIPGTPIDFVGDLGLAKAKFRQLKLVVRPATKHKFRLEITPIKYEADTVLERDLVFNGIAYHIGVPVTSTLQWNAWRFGYEYDFLYRERGFVGVVLEAKYTDVQVNLDSLVASEWARARAPIPAVGGIGRVYVAPNVAVTFEVTGIEVPRFNEDYKAHYVEYDFYGTFNFNNYVGAQVGYRALDVNYQIDLDLGDFLLKGPYFGFVARF
jgi:hypothetical protein